MLLFFLVILNYSGRSLYSHTTDNAVIFLRNAYELRLPVRKRVAMQSLQCDPLSLTLGGPVTLFAVNMARITNLYELKSRI